MTVHRTLAAAAAAALLLVGCGGPPNDVPPATDTAITVPVANPDPDEVNDAVTRVFCEDYYEWAQRAATISTETDTVASHQAITDLASRADGSDIGDGLVTLLHRLGAYADGDADATDLNSATISLLTTCHAAGWTSP